MYLKDSFEIKIINQRFLTKDNEDVCSHGEIYLNVNGTIISDTEDDEWNINESALILLRTVKYGFPTNSKPYYYPDDLKEESIINHCGAYMMFCPSNIIWKVDKKEDFVKLYDFIKDEDIEYKGLEAIVPLKTYASQIYKFAKDASSLFENKNIKYKSSELFEGMYSLFWKEYDELLKYIEGEVGL